MYVIRLRFLLLMPIAVFTFAGCGGSGKSADQHTASSGQSHRWLKVALVSTQRAGDHGPVDSMVAALAKAKSNFKLSTKFIEATDPSSYQPTLQRLGQAGYDIVVTTFPDMQQPVQSVAGSFPKTKFILIFGDAFKQRIENARSISYQIYPGFYLGGILAASVSKTGKLGYVGGAPQPALNADFHAYVAGAKSVNRNVVVKGAWAGSFQDPAKGHEIAASMYAGGIDVIQTDAAATTLGVERAAKEKSGYVISDSAPSAAAQDPQHIIGTSFLQFGDSLYAQVKAAVSPGWHGGLIKSGIKDGITGLYVSKPFLARGPAPAIAKIKSALPLIQKKQAAIVAGSLKVPFNTGPIG